MSVPGGCCGQVVDIVELGPIAGKVVGVPGASGLSVEQRKRLTIAIELVSNPSVIFMDEPTSGLDARAAAIVMRAVKNVSRNNRTVMVRPLCRQPCFSSSSASSLSGGLQRTASPCCCGGGALRAPLADRQVTIHQPSIDIFETFESLILLQRGGKVCAGCWLRA